MEWILLYIFLPGVFWFLIRLIIYYIGGISATALWMGLTPEQKSKVKTWLIVLLGFIIGFFVL